jgi:hypothetical protein
VIACLGGRLARTSVLATLARQQLLAFFRQHVG